MVSARVLLQWLQKLPPRTFVGIDEGGLTLCRVDRRGRPTDEYFEIGGVNDGDEEEEDE